jgi:hypothetical protein
MTGDPTMNDLSRRDTERTHDSTALATTESHALIYRHELTVEEILAQAAKIKAVMKQAMEDGVHFGTIPGTPKPTLFKPGAEKLCLLFRLDPQYLSTETFQGEHLMVKSVCTLWHIPSGQRFGSGEGSCSTRESKYAWRFSKRACPACSTEAIGKSKPEFGGGWYCNKKAGGCGQSFKPGSEGARAIEGQREVGKIVNPDLADQYNTVLKMANKRALVAAVLNCTAASDVFTQDLEDDDQAGVEAAPRREASPVRREEPPGERPAQDGEALVTENQIKRLMAIAGKHWTEEQLHELIAGFQYESRKQIKVKDYDRICDLLKRGPIKVAQPA